MGTQHRKRAGAGKGVLSKARWSSTLHALQLGVCMWMPKPSVDAQTDLSVALLNVVMAADICADMCSCQRVLLSHQISTAVVLMLLHRCP